MDLDLDSDIEVTIEISTYSELELSDDEDNYVERPPPSVQNERNRSPYESPGSIRDPNYSFTSTIVYDNYSDDEDYIERSPKSSRRKSPPSPPFSPQREKQVDRSRDRKPIKQTQEPDLQFLSSLEYESPPRGGVQLQRLNVVETGQLVSRRTPPRDEEIRRSPRTRSPSQTSERRVSASYEIEKASRSPREEENLRLPQPRRRSRSPESRVSPSYEPERAKPVQKIDNIEKISDKQGPHTLTFGPVTYEDKQGRIITVSHSISTDIDGSDFVEKRSDSVSPPRTPPSPPEEPASASPVRPPESPPPPPSTPSQSSITAVEVQPSTPPCEDTLEQPQRNRRFRSFCYILGSVIVVLCVINIVVGIVLLVLNHGT